MNHFGFSRTSFDSDIKTTKNLVRVPPATESKRPTSDKRLGELVPLWFLPTNILRFRSENIMSGNNGVVEYTGSVRLASCKMNVDHNQHFQEINSLSIPKKNYADSKI